MHSKSDLIDGLYVILTWLMRFVTVNILWFATNLPSLMIIFNLLLGKGNTVLSVGLLIGCQVLLFYPSVTALYTVMNDWKVEKEYDHLFKKYIGAFLSQYKRSLKSSIVWIVIALIWLIDYMFFAQVSGLMEVVVLVIGAVLFCMSVLYMALFVQNRYRMVDMFKLSLRLTLTEPLIFLMIVLSFIILLRISIYFMWFVIPFLIAALHACLVLEIIHKWTLCTN